MSKAKTLATTVSTGGVLADGTVSASEVSGLAAVATSGSYGDLSGRPTLPTGDIVGTSDTQTLTNKTVSGAFNATNGIYVSKNAATSSQTIASGDNALSVGPFTVSSGVTITVSANSIWNIL
jgi:hypothetical protein